MNVLVLRFSSISNVAAMVPIVNSLVETYADNKIIVASRSFLKPLFDTLHGVQFFDADIRKRHKGVFGAVRMYFDLRSYKIDRIIDLQNNYKTFILRILFWFNGVPSNCLHKNRFKNIILSYPEFFKKRTFKNLHEEYIQTFLNAGFKIDEKFAGLKIDQEATKKIIDCYGVKKSCWIGIAPFAKKKGKMLSMKKMKEVLAYFDAREGYRIFLFGAGEVENEVLSDWESIFKNTQNVNTRLNLREELALISQLDVMICMDSANMHLTSIVNTKVVSVWGSTHYAIGNPGYNMPAANIIEIPLACRPCSISGTNRCRQKTFECLSKIDSKDIIRKTIEILQKEKKSV